VDVVRCVLEWKAESDPVDGRLIAPDSSVHQFSGWLEFLTIADAIRRQEAAALPDEPAGGERGRGDRQ
jgi:hypothetical protein